MYYSLDTEKLNHELRLKEAEKERLAFEIMKETGKTGFNPTLAWVGRRMVDIGTSLVKLAGAQKTSAPDLN